MTGWRRHKQGQTRTPAEDMAILNIVHRHRRLRRARTVHPVGNSFAENASLAERRGGRGTINDDRLRHEFAYGRLQMVLVRFGVDADIASA